MKFKSIVWASTIDYPNEVSTVLFVGTCNWDCQYCYNNNLKNKPDIDFETEILPRLIDRKGFVNHIVISGGECTIYPELESVIDTLKNNGFKVGIHSNGSRPKVIQNILPKIDFIGMDIKTSGSNLESAAMTVNSNTEYEFRTTLYPKYISINNCNIIARELKYIVGAKEWVLQQYTNEFNKQLINPYSKEEILKILEKCNKIIPTKLKGDSQ